MGASLGNATDGVGIHPGWHVHNLKVRSDLGPYFVRNHKSWEDDEAAQAALWPEVAKMLWRGVLEYVARHCRLPLCIMACGAIPTSTSPFDRRRKDCPTFNDFADPWSDKNIPIAISELLITVGDDSG